MTVTTPPKITHTDSSSLNVRAIVTALKAIEQAAVSTGGSKIAEMPLGDLILALKEVGVNADNAGKVDDGVNADNAGKVDDGVNADNAGKVDDAKAALNAGALARRKAIEDALMNMHHKKLPSYLTVTPVYASDLHHEKRRLTVTPVDVSDFTDADFSDFAPSEENSVDSPKDDVMPHPGTSVRPTSVRPNAAAGDTGPSSAAGSTGPSSSAVDEATPLSGYTSGTFSSGGHLKGFVCFNCKAYSTIVGGSDAWYAVAKGKSVGVFRGWESVAPLVVGVSRSTFTRHDTRAEAEDVYQTAVCNGNVEVRPY